MTKVSLQKAEAMVKRLTIADKVRLVKKLERQTARIRWDRLFAEIDHRRQNRRFSVTDIQREIDAVRRQRRGGVADSRRS